MIKKLTLLAAVAMLLTSIAAPAREADAAALGSGMTKFRVYQNDMPLKEFAKEGDAIRYAGGYAYSHVETISDRKWLWDNFPRYKVYANGTSIAKWEFRTFDQAAAVAKTMKDAYVRDLQNVGWSFDTFSKFRLYQGDATLPNWGFRTLEDAKKEAKKWANAHIIDLSTNAWIWDNLTAAQVAAQKAADPVYQLELDGEPVPDSAVYSFLKDAVAASLQLPNSQVVHTGKDKIVYSNVPAYEVRQNGKLIKTYIGLEPAVKYAKTLANAEVLLEGKQLWSSYPYLEVYQGDKKIKTFHKLSSALAYAKYYANISIRTLDGRKLWNNAKTLQLLGWNGSSGSQTIMNHVANTQGLSIDSPTWFELTDADGTMKDTSDIAVVNALKEQDILVTPLVHNGFDRSLTTEFLTNKAAQTKFIGALVAKASALGVHGINLDFEEVAASDRAAFTAFVKQLTTAAHAKKLKVSIDLLRGDAAWNHLTAYDHAAIGAIVDTVIVMAYDEHWRGSKEPGSVAGLHWVEEGVKQYLDYGIPRSKLMLGIPFYVREWRIDAAGKLVDNRAILMKELPELIAEQNAVGVFDAESGQTKYTYVKDGYTHVFWAETHDTVLKRIAIAKKYDLAGVAFWRLGYEDADLWTKILRAKSS
ncbi:glycosyl hydrolase family 18 protein [Paenibacillus soyae]|uniref:Glycosyl hydrolase family 18 protein n=1 Tax=Paenibacillus soyae TaxID=2969249 RepID=A0A9X2MMN4_9BACL|nr:glycosyl hydrolase family 18 protein [Paenibacillus soyae]MCR2802919.1 glycosyl hydrolase family 18 protein [Paenibacillus soyae]